MTKQILYKNYFLSNLAYCGQCVICITIFFLYSPSPFFCCSFSLIIHFLYTCIVFTNFIINTRFLHTRFSPLYNTCINLQRANRIVQGHANTFPAKIPLQNASKLGRRLTYKFVIDTCTLFVMK